MAVVTRPKPFVPGGHHGVLLPNGMVAHSTPERGEHVSTLAEYAAGAEVEVIRYVSPEHHAETMCRIWEALQNPAPHDSLTNNCQHFASRMAGEPAASPAVAALVVGVCLVGVVALAARA